METNNEIRPYIAPALPPDLLYRREVKRALMKVVLVVGAYFLIQLVVTGIIQAIVMFSAGFFDNMLTDMMNTAESGASLNMDELMNSAQGDAVGAVGEYVGLISIIAALAALPIFMILRGKRLFGADIIEQRAKLPAPDFIKIYIIAMGAQLVFNVGASLLDMALNRSGRSVTDTLEQAMQMLQSPTGLLYICLIGPIIEEIIFRGAILKSLERFGQNFAIVISSLVFGLFHIFTVQAVFAFFMGLILGYIASRYSLKWAMLTHILINSVATGVGYLSTTGGEGAAGSSYLSSASNLILLALFAGGMILLVKDRWRIKEQKLSGVPIRIPGSPEDVGKALWSAAFTSIPLLAYIALTLSAGIAMIFIDIPGLT
jgi:membrane protease YdiL (CAAX protease family)